jgi:chemotaxis protein CheC
MILSAVQRDALTEVVNIGAGRAAKRIATMLEDEVEMVVPVVDLVDYEDLPGFLSIAAEEDVVCIQQEVSGSITGDIMLLFYTQEGLRLMQQLIAPLQPFNAGSDDEMRRFENEAMTEVGNIIISACASAISGFLAGAVKMKVPTYNEGALDKIIPQIVQSQGETKALVMRASLRALKREVSTTLIITLSVDNLNSVLKRLDEILAGLHLT